MAVWIRNEQQVANGRGEICIWPKFCRVTVKKMHRDNTATVSGFPNVFRNGQDIEFATYRTDLRRKGRFYFRDLEQDAEEGEP